MTILLLMLSLLLALWSIEAWRHRRALAALPIRIHVNGSRGKSSVTRLIAGGLREGGIRTVAKTTGSDARLILPDGGEEPVIRRGPPNVREQIDILCRARRERAQAIVMECMAVRPDLQRVTEEQIMRSHVGVITNIRADHLDVMGPTLSDVAIALSSVIPRNGTAVVGEARYRAVLDRVADARGSKLVVARRDDLPPSAMDGFGYVEHEENVATALAVTRLFKVPDTTALRGMHRAAPDIGACTRWEIEHGGRSIEFVNAFAANDLESTVAMWQRLGFGLPQEATTVALLNLRGDRIERSLQFADAAGGALRADYYFLVGDYNASVLRRYRRRIAGDRLLALGQTSPREIFDRIAERSSRRARVGAIGNIGGLGREILRYVVEAHGGRAAC